MSYTSLPLLRRDDLEIVLTEDGTTSLRRKATGWWYRSRNGALTESRTVFIEGTKIKTIDNAWTIVELGFGGACNFIATVTEGAGRKIDYHAIDHSPIPPEMIQVDCIGGRLAKRALIQCRETREPCHVKEGTVNLTLYPSCWSQMMVTNLQADAFFFDPFSPNDNPEAWSLASFEWAVTLCKSTAILATYAAQGQMRRNMRDAGLFVARGPGYGGKRESTLASKTKSQLMPFPIKYSPS